MVNWFYLSTFNWTTLTNFQKVQQLFLLQGLQSVLKIWRSFDIRRWQVKVTGPKLTCQIINHWYKGQNKSNSSTCQSFIWQDFPIFNVQQTLIIRKRNVGHTRLAAHDQAKSSLRLQLHDAIYRPNSFVLMLRYCANLKAIRSRYESTSLNRIVANESHSVIVASYASKSSIIFYWLIWKTVKNLKERFLPFVNICFHFKNMNFQSLGILQKIMRKENWTFCAPLIKIATSQLGFAFIQYWNPM